MLALLFSGVMKRALLGALFVFMVPTGALAVARAPAETELLQAINEITRGEVDAASTRLAALLKAHPNYRLAQLVQADLLLAQGRPLAGFGNGDPTRNERLMQLRDELLTRARAAREAPGAGRVPASLVSLPAELKHAIVVDAERSRLYVFRNNNGVPELVSDFYTTIGKAGADKLFEGDRRTPLGVYFVTGSRPKKSLTDFYGSGAFPLNYPNEWDKLMGRAGSGIWIHGVPPDTYARPPKDSDGCVVVANSDLDAIAKLLQFGQTPVVIGRNIQWVQLADWQRDRQPLIARFKGWAADWEKGGEAVVKHYSRLALVDGKRYADWLTRFSGKEPEEARSVDGDSVTLIRDPAMPHLFVVSFEQTGRGKQGAVKARMRQYWLREGEDWRIIWQGQA
jgi:murein L,D-transpeptidase YafK